MTATMQAPTAVTPLTDAERALWKQAQDDYKRAVAIVSAVWFEKDEATPLEVVQAGAATVLIHITKLRQGVRQSQPAKAAEPTLAVDHGAIPEACPECQSEMWDNRGDKKNPRSPDFKCKECGHAIWLTPPPKSGGKARR